MNDTAMRTLQAGQTYDSDYDVPDLAIGQKISGRTVIAAVRQVDGRGYLPGLHIVVAYDPGSVTPWVTWEVAWQPYTDDERKRRRVALQPVAFGRWVASSGHYFYAGQARDAHLDMIHRAGRAPGEEV